MSCGKSFCTKVCYIVQEYNLIDRTIDSFWLSYDDYLTDEITREESKEVGLTDRSSVYIKLAGYSFHVSTSVDFDYISVKVYCYREKENIPIIEYHCTYFLNGELFEDYFLLK